jgi:hypothetical protein
MMNVRLGDQPRRQWMAGTAFGQTGHDGEM